MVWVDSSPALDPALAGSLCRRHADALIVPKGWRIEDRRESIPRLFHAPDISEVHDADSTSAGIVALEQTPSGGVRRRAHKGSHESSSQASLFDEIVAGSVVETVEGVSDVVGAAVVADNLPKVTTGEADDATIDDDIEETRAIPWMPRLVSRTTVDADDDSDGDAADGVDATPAQGRLLRRAFGDRNVR